jgi:hypothetical protein
MQLASLPPTRPVTLVLRLSSLSPAPSVVLPGPLRERGPVPELEAVLERGQLPEPVLVQPLPWSARAQAMGPA